jgi:glycosyltransferase involved in cell wall biosynthesis
MICKFANTIIVHSSSAREALLGDYRIPSSKIRVVHHGIGFLETSTPHDMLENNVLFFGNITPSKGLEPLISAFELVKTPNSKLIIAGGAHPRGQEYFQKIEKTIQTSRKSSEIVTTGYVPDQEIHRLFDQCRVAVFPYTFSVSCSGGLSFALQHRKPTIVTSLPSFTEVIIDGCNGLVVPPNDEEALAKAIDHVLSDQNLQEQLSQGVAKECANLSWSEIASETVKCYHA